METVDTVVVGAGQAGLSASWLLGRRGRPHLVLERGDVADTWRTQRWDDFVLNTPNWGQRLPGFAYAGDDPDGFAPLREVIEYLEAYARAGGAPVRTHAEVTSVRRDGDGFVLEAGGERIGAANVVLATGAFQRPVVPAVAAGAADTVLQLHSSEYRNPGGLAPGGVLIVGSGQSGCQIADDLLAAGRRVVLSVGRCPWFPRRVAGRDIVHWAIELGLMDQTVDVLPSPAARAACNPAVSGNDGGHDCNPPWLAGRGAELVGRVTAIAGTRVSLGDDLAQNLANGDAFVADLTARIAEHAGAPVDAPRPSPGAPSPPRELDLAEEEIGTILWATGYRPDYGWVEPLAVDAAGWPVQQRGVTAVPGLYLLGLNWLHTRKSALFVGVGEDAEHVVSHLDATRPRG